MWSITTDVAFAIGEVQLSKPFAYDALIPAVRRVLR
jgi:hypothetical protein